MFQKILLASDGSDSALKAATTAADLAIAFGAILEVVHVYTLPTQFIPGRDAAETYIDPAFAGDLVPALITAVTERTGRVLEQAGAAFTIRHENGHPAEVISEIATREGFDLIVLGSKDRTPLEAVRPGSIADRVFHHVPCSVLVVK